MLSKVKKDIKKAFMLSLFPGLGFLYLENIKYFCLFFILTFLPLIGISNMGASAILGSLLMYALSIYYCVNLAKETQRNTEVYKKDPYYMMCMSVLVDGLGQIILGQKKKAFIMMALGFTNCLVVWSILIMNNGLIDLILAPRENSLFMVVNIMVTWTVVSIPVKLISLIDAYYSTYHLYVAKK